MKGWTDAMVRVVGELSGMKEQFRTVADLEVHGEPPWTEVHLRALIGDPWVHLRPATMRDAVGRFEGTGWAVYGKDGSLGLSPKQTQREALMAAGFALSPTITVPPTITFRHREIRSKASLENPGSDASAMRPFSKVLEEEVMRMVGEDAKRSEGPAQSFTDGMASLQDQLLAIIQHDTQALQSSVSRRNTMIAEIDALLGLELAHEAVEQAQVIRMDYLRAAMEHRSRCSVWLAEVDNALGFAGSRTQDAGPNGEAAQEWRMKSIALVQASAEGVLGCRLFMVPPESVPAPTRENQS